MIIVSFLKPQLCDSAPRFLFRDHGVGSTDHFLKFLYYTSFLTPHDPCPH